jgi:hypothetical protein
VVNDGADVGPQVEDLRRMLEQELEREVRPFEGCWPLAIGIAGVVMALLVLLDLV